MGLFSKLFGKKASTDTSTQAIQAAPQQTDNLFIATTDGTEYSVIRQLTDEQKEKLDASTLLLRTGQLYMHYWTDNLDNTNRNDPEWQNKVMFFWKAEEPFPKKSLPPVFETFQKKYFLFTGDTSGISLQAGAATPWFGMPGLGEKHMCEIHGQTMTIPELYELGVIDYVEQVELHNGNPAILTNRDDYFFLIDESVTVFHNGQFYLASTPVPIYIAYSVGGIHIIRRTGFHPAN